MQKTDSFEKTLRLGKIEGRRRKGQQWMASPTQWTWVWVNLGSCDRQGSLACCGPWGRKELDTTERLNWTGPKSQSWWDAVVALGMWWLLRTSLFALGKLLEIAPSSSGGHHIESDCGVIRPGGPSWAARPLAKGRRCSVSPVIPSHTTCGALSTSR